MNIALNFVNQSNDTNNSEVVIFQKNVATDFSEAAVAWMVIQNCGPGDNHPFHFPTTLAVSTNDSYGNYTPRLSAQPGQLFVLAQTPNGHQLAPGGSSSHAAEIQVLNGTAHGAIGADIYRGEKLLATKTAIAPQQKAVFQFRPTIWIGIVSEIVEGQVMNSAILASVNTELSLLGIASADIVMTGGGPGPDSTPLQFSFENVVVA